MESSYVVFDIDGLLTDNRWRQHLAPQTGGALTSDFDRFNEAGAYDSPVDSSMLLLESILLSPNLRPMFLTGRPEKWRELTVKWLWDSCPEPLRRAFTKGSLDLLMRPNDDPRPSGEVKVSLLYDRFGNAELARQNVLCIFEDSQSNADALRTAGYDVYVLKGYGPEDETRHN